jgi:hypothetical protein
LCSGGPIGKAALIVAHSPRHGKRKASYGVQGVLAPELK